MNDLIEVTRRWIATDPDSNDAEELQRICDQAEEDIAHGIDDSEACRDLGERMGSLIRFGTAGLRGAIGAGSSRMNTATVQMASAALATRLRAQLASGGQVVIGYDARHRSHDFAVRAAGVFTAAGFDVSMMPSPLPTPVLAYAVKAFNADIGIQITASHNPPQDNGYKVYLGGQMTSVDDAGLQIIPPFDAEVLDIMASYRDPSAIPVADSGWTIIGTDLIDSYINTVATLYRSYADRAVASCDLSHEEITASAGTLKVVLTAMHGVGYEVCEKILNTCGIGTVEAVVEQKDPDPDFPTVSFPNPEEKGALDCAFATAERVGADLILALDPDADRLAVAFPRRDGWYQLSGDELAAIFADFVASCWQQRGDLAISRSLPTGRWCAAIADHYGLKAVETLGGFKWIARVKNLVFGAEEAIGYCLNPSAVRDKDGMSAAAIICLIASIARCHGKNCEDLLDDIALRCGLYMTRPLTVRMDDRSRIDAIMERLADSSIESLAEEKVDRYIDLSSGYDSLPPTSGYLIASRSHRVIVRPSGTEPKLKCYLETWTHVRDRGELAQAKRSCSQILDRLDEQISHLCGIA